MMHVRWKWLLVVVLLVFTLRLTFAFQTPFFTSDESYFHIRIIQTLAEGKLPFFDHLNNRTLIINPLFELILAFFTLFIPAAYALKVLPNLLASLLAIPIYLFAYRLTHHHALSLFIAFLANIIPAYFSFTFNHILPATLAIPLFFFLAYAWLTPNSPRWIIAFLFSLCFLVLLHPISLIFILSIALYFLLSLIERLPITKAEYELGLFTIFFTIWAHFLIYKKIILFHGASLLWQQSPHLFSIEPSIQVNLLVAISYIGLIPVADGIRALYSAAFKKPTKETLLLLSITIVTTLLLWLRIIELVFGFMILGITLTLAFANGINTFYLYLRQTKFARAARPIISFIIVIALVTTALPAYFASISQLSTTITQEDAAALVYLSTVSLPAAKTAAPPEYGNYITALANRSVILDSYLFMQSSITETAEDIDRIYKTSFETEAVELLDRYNATYIVIPPHARDITYAGHCFKPIWQTRIRIYEKDAACYIKVLS